MNQYLRIVLVVAALAVLAGTFACSGRAPDYPRVLLPPPGDHAGTASWLGFDPLAPGQQPAPLSLETLRTSAGLEKDGYKLVALDENSAPCAPPDGLRMDTEAGGIALKLTEPVAGDLYLYLFYPSAEMSVTESSAGGSLGDEYVFLGVPVEPDAVAIGIARIRAHGEPMVPAGEIARVRFGAPAASSGRGVSAVPVSTTAAVDDLVVAVNQDGTVSLSWTERHPGDYNNDGIVNIQDVTPIAMLFNQEAETAPDPGRLDLVDGNRDGRVNIQDVTPIAINFLTLVGGYTIYRTQLANGSEDPSVDDTGRWTYVPREGAEPPEQMPSVVRDYTGQQFRLPYTFKDDSFTPGYYYAYFVRPFSQESDDPSEGPVSNVAKTSQPTGMATLLLEVLNGPFFFLDTDVIVRVVLEDGAGVFSVNARIEYRKDVLEFVSAAPSLEGQDANLLFDADYGGDPLFLGARVGPAQNEPEYYDLAAFNATKRYPAPTVFGSGPVAYFTFHVIGGAGPYPEAFRFPQGSTNIWVWGEQYNVPLPGPQLGAPALVNISGD